MMKLVTMVEFLQLKPRCGLRVCLVCLVSLVSSCWCLPVGVVMSFPLSYSGGCETIDADSYHLRSNVSGGKHWQAEHVVRQAG